MNFKIKLFKSITLFNVLLVSTFVFYSCQKESLEEDGDKVESTLETSQRNACIECPNLIENGDFEDVCFQSVDHFITADCVGGDWTNVFGTADVRDGNLYGNNSLRTQNGEVIFDSETVVTNTSLKAGIEYCLDFDSFFKNGTSSSNIALWQVCLLATDNLQENTNRATPCTLNDPQFLSNHEPMFCHELEIGQDNYWLSHSATFTLTQNHNQVWPILLPKFDISNFASSYANLSRFDNIYISCESKLFSEIETSTMGDCAFIFNPIAETAYPANAIEVLWDFGDGNSSTELMPHHQYLEKGTYDVTLTYTDHNGCCNTLKTTIECESEENCIVELCWTDFIGHFRCVKEIELIFNDGTPPLVVPVNDIPINQGYANIANAFIQALIQSGIDYTFTQQHPFGPNFDCYKGGIGLVPGWYVQSEVLEQFIFHGGKCGSNEIDASVSSTNDNCD